MKILLAPLFTAALLLMMGLFCAVTRAQEVKAPIRLNTNTLSQPRSGSCDPNESLPTDLSGVYEVSGKSVSPGWRNRTLTINKNRFEVSDGSGVLQTGGVVATTTCGYTAVALIFEAPIASPHAPAFEVMSTRAVASKDGGTVWLNAVSFEKSHLALTLTVNPDKMYDVHFITDPTTKPVNIITDLKWRQCPQRDKDPKKCPWQSAGEPEKMLGAYHYLVEWSDGKSKKGELEVYSNKTFTITP